MPEMSEQRLREIELRVKYASEGPWSAEMGYIGNTRALFLVRGKRFDGVLFGRSYDEVETAQHEADTTFSAHARVDVPDLIAALRAEREENNRLRQREARLEKAWLTERSQLLWLDEMTQGRFSWNDVTEFDQERYRRQAGRGLTGTLGADS